MAHVWMIFQWLYYLNRGTKVVGSYSRQVEEEINRSHFWVQNTLLGLFYYLFIKSRFTDNHKSREDYSVLYNRMAPNDLNDASICRGKS